MRLPRRQVPTPLLGFGDALEQGKAPLQQMANVGHHDGSADEPTELTEGHGEAELVGEGYGSVDVLGEGVIVLEEGKSAREHGVLEEDGGFEAADETLMKLRQAELPPFPFDGVSTDDEAGGSAGDGVHPQLLLDESDAGGEEETALERGVHYGLVSEGEHTLAVMRGTQTWRPRFRPSRRAITKTWSAL